MPASPRQRRFRDANRVDADPARDPRNSPQFARMPTALALHYAASGNSVRNSLLIAAIVGLALFSSSGCVSRTLPLPPPEVSSVSSPTMQGLVTVKGFCLEG